jgi:ABC-type uncharacterized transport system auxiliary subunit
VLDPVAVREFACPQYLCEGRIVYRSSAEGVGFYEFHRWAVSPRQVTDALRAQSVFKTVSLYESGSESAYVLTGTIERLEEVDEDRDVRAVCTISVQLTDTRTRSVVWNHTVSEEVRVAQRNVAGVVSSLSAAARTTVDRLAASVGNELEPGQTH